jgi:hypothetical protein
MAAVERCYWERIQELQEENDRLQSLVDVGIQVPRVELPAEL